jgi:hypothetical protein
MMGPWLPGLDSNEEHPVQSRIRYHYATRECQRTSILHRRPAVLQARSFGVAPAIGFGLAVTIWAEHSEVFQTMVRPLTVDMVYLDGQGLAEPLTQPALFAAVLEEPRSQKSQFDIAPRSALRQNYLKWSG